MELDAIVAMASGAGMWVVGFGWAIWERRRNAKLQEARIRDLKEWVNFQAQNTVFPTRVNGEDTQG